MYPCHSMWEVYWQNWKLITWSLNFWINFSRKSLLHCFLWAEKLNRALLCAPQQLFWQTKIPVGFWFTPSIFFTSSKIVFSFKEIWLLTLFSDKISVFEGKNTVNQTIFDRVDDCWGSFFWFMADGDNPGLLHPALHTLQHQRSRPGPEFLSAAGLWDCGQLPAAACTEEENTNTLQYR